MLFNLYKSNSPIMHVLTVMIAVVLWLPIFGNPQWTPSINEGSALYNEFICGMFSSVWGTQLVAFALMLIEAFLLLRIDLKFIIVENKTILPPLFFVLVVSSLAPNYNLLPVLVANLFFMLAMTKILDSEQMYEMPKQYFESGLLIGIGTLFFPPLVATMFFVFASQFVIRFFKMRDFLAAILGYITPFVFYLFGMFMTDQTDAFFDRMSQISLTQAFTIELSVVQYGAICFSCLIVFFALFTMSQCIRMYKVTTRKYFSLFFWLILLTVAAFFVIPSSGMTLLVFAAIALSFIATLYFMEIRHNAMAEILFLLIIVSAFLIVYFQ